MVDIARETMLQRSRALSRAETRYADTLANLLRALQRSRALSRAET